MNVRFETGLKFAGDELIGSSFFKEWLDDCVLPFGWKMADGKGLIENPSYERR